MVADPTTHRIAGERLVAGLAADGLPCELLVLKPRSAGATVVADDENVEAVARIVREARGSIVAGLAVGAGTINDLVKRATHQTRIPYGVLATAPSMNGYTSPIAAILSAGVKTVQEAQTPAAVVADVDILAAAPPRLIASGYGDLLSKPVSNADWRLSHWLTGSKYCADAIRLVEEGTRLLDGVAAGLKTGDREAVARLTGALILSGYAMALAGTSAPASGGEHLISHYLDMTHYGLGEPGDLHGCQVGVGTLASASLYERLFAWDPASLEIEDRVAAWLSWPRYEEGVRAHFGVLADSVIPLAREGYPDAAALRARLTRVKSEWPGFAARLRPGLRTAAAIRADLITAGCPTTFAELGCAPERARRAFYLGKDIRARYTVLHLCREIGRLETWGEEILPGLF